MTEDAAMIDITRELRNRIEEVYGGHGTVKEFPDDLCHRAADEIDRLRARADALAAALREIAKDDDLVAASEGAFGLQAYRRCRDHARGALAAHDRDA